MEKEKTVYKTTLKLKPEQEVAFQNYVVTIKGDLTTVMKPLVCFYSQSLRWACDFKLNEVESFTIEEEKTKDI